MNALGEEGYLRIYRDLIGVVKQYRTGIEKAGFRIVGDPVGTVLSFEAPAAVNIHVIADLMEKRGWFVDRQMNPDSIHLTITPANAPVVERYCQDLAESADYARAHPELGGEGMAAMYGMVAKLPDPTQVNQFLYHYMDQRYQT
jgi:glutamate/tyrosine decarboxylase-like PLP-dependent enzyme